MCANEFDVARFAQHGEMQPSEMMPVKLVGVIRVEPSQVPQWLAEMPKNCEHC